MPGAAEIVNEHGVSGAGDWGGASYRNVFFKTGTVVETNPMAWARFKPRTIVDDALEGDDYSNPEASVAYYFRRRLGCLDVQKSPFVRGVNDCAGPVSKIVIQIKTQRIPFAFVHLAQFILHWEGYKRDGWTMCLVVNARTDEARAVRCQMLFLATDMQARSRLSSLSLPLICRVILASSLQCPRSGTRAFCSWSVTPTATLRAPRAPLVSAGSSYWTASTLPLPLC